jgi:Raf kinase inhibitor-like YbhB/YbcL family protein
MDRRDVLALAAAPVLVVLASCGAGDQPASQANGGTAMDNPTISKISVASNAFRDGRPIPTQFTCDGANQPPRISWGEPPPGTKSFALVIVDPDAPGGTFRHWGVFNIPASTRSLGGGLQIGTEVTNDFGKPGYGGPCPPEGKGAHHYHFRLFALDTERLALGSDAKVLDVENEARKHATAEGELIGTYERR